jgi:hypothetical protein
MGMFDYIKIDESIHLPLPEEMKKFDIEFQTKSLDNSMSAYLIADDRNLYELDAPWDCEKKSDEPVKKINLQHHGKIRFYAYEQTDTLDFCADFEAKFTDGVLDAINLIDYKKIEHESIKLKMQKFLEKDKKERNKISYRFKKFIKNKTLSIFKIKSNQLRFTSPEVLLFFSKPREKENNYGLYFNKIDTGFKFTKTDFHMEVKMQVLGFGFIFQKFDLDQPSLDAESK